MRCSVCMIIAMKFSDLANIDINSIYLANNRTLYHFVPVYKPTWWLGSTCLGLYGAVLYEAEERTGR